MNKNEVYVKALEDLIEYAKANPEKVEEFFARVKEIKEQMYQDFEAIRKGKGIVICKQTSGTK